MIVVADTSALYAAFDASHDDHEACRAMLTGETLAISPLVLTELDHLAQRDLGFAAALEIATAVGQRIDAGAYRLATVKPADLAVAHGVRVRYESLRLDLADALGVVIADHYRTDRILTLDQRDFRAITPLTPGFAAFRLLPADAA